MILATYLGQKKKIFLAVDDEPVSKIDICLSAVASKLFPDATVPQVRVASIAEVRNAFCEVIEYIFIHKFISDAGPQGKLCDDSKSRVRIT